ncbi:MAG: LuxR family transcriptional regulator [Chloroflexia bacterium]|nr:LuxR family transcriptional regulator [Chloroflexia bacterium]
MLVLLDNCEHLVSAVVDLVAALLARCPAVQVLATSRAPLRLRGEHELTIDPLALPSANSGEHGDAADNPAVQLFVERSRAVGSSWDRDAGALADVVEICQRLDGLPLAIELAAARTRVLALPVLRDRLEHSLPLLAGGARDAPARQRTMRDTIAWSYELLVADEQALFRRLSVFSGGFTLDAAQAVAAGDGEPDLLPQLDRLAEQHLIRPLPNTSEPRFTMLETIREFGLERLHESGLADETRARHAAYFRELVDTLNAWVASYLPEAQQILTRLETEYPNLRAAMTWQRATGDVSGLLELAGALFFFWQLRGHLRDGRAWLEWGLAQDAAITARARAMGQLGLSGILYVQHEIAESLALGEQSLRYYRASNDTPGIARASDHVACVALIIGDLDLTTTYIAESLAALSALGDAPWARRLVSHVKNYQGWLALQHDGWAEAERFIREVVQEQEQIAREDSAEHTYACWPRIALGLAIWGQGARQEALPHIQQALDHAWRHHELRCIAMVLVDVANMLAETRRWEEAARLFGATEAYCQRTGLSFFGDVWNWQAAGVPEPWCGAIVPAANSEEGRIEPLASGTALVPPVPALAAEIWAAGRELPIAEAVALALAVDLDAPPVVSSVATIATSVRPPSAHGLSIREREVLGLLCERLTDSEIAARLFISPRTAEGHVAHILGKLGVENRRDAAAVAARLALV